jgi:hypothetical protein
MSISTILPPAIVNPMTENARPSERRDAPGGTAGVMIERPDGGCHEIVEGSYGRYLPSGHLIYLQGATLFAVAFDLERLAPIGQAVPVIEGIMASDTATGAQFAVSGTGTLVYVPGERTVSDPPISWLDRRGQVTPLLLKSGPWSNPRFSPDGRRLAVDIIDGLLDIWLYDLTRRSFDRLVLGSNVNSGEPVWTPDSQRIVFRQNQGAGTVSNLFWRRADLTGDVQRLTSSPQNQQPGSWHPSGKYLAFHQTSEKTNPDIWILPMDGDDVSGWKPGAPTVWQNTEPTSTSRCSHRTAVGWRTCRTRTAPSRYSCGCSRGAGDRGRFLPAAAGFPSGRPRSRSCSTARSRKRLWSPRIASRATRSRRISRAPGRRRVSFSFLAVDRTTYILMAIALRSPPFRETWKRSSRTNWCSCSTSSTSSAVAYR